jgi:hypothetical protein
MEVDHLAPVGLEETALIPNAFKNKTILMPVDPEPEQRIRMLAAPRIRILQCL